MAEVHFTSHLRNLVLNRAGNNNVIHQWRQKLIVTTIMLQKVAALRIANSISMG